jgi:hypothetical protein
MKLPGLDEAPGGTRLFAVLTFGNLIGWVKGNVAGFVDDAGSSSLISFFKKGELIPMVAGTEMLAVVTVLLLPSPVFGNVAAVSRSFPPPNY